MTQEYKKSISNKFARWLTLGFSLSVISIFILLVVYILLVAIKGFGRFNFMDILFGWEFSPNDNKYSFWIPFSISFITTLIAIGIAIPIGIKVALFTKYRLYKKYRKYVIIIFQVLSGIPSVIFGLFATKALGIVWLKIFKINPNSIFNGSIMLSFMIIPTIVTLSLDSFNNVDNTLINNSLALGNNKTKSIYKIALKAARPGILVGIILAISRAIGEATSVSMILQATPSSSIYNEGIFNFLNSSSQTLGAFISTSMFADKDPEHIRPLLYTFGFIMLIISMILNMFILSFSKKKHAKKNSKLVKFEKQVFYYLTWIPKKLKLLFEKITFKPQAKIYKNNDQIENIHEYITDRNINYKFKHAYSIWKMFWEVLSVVICFLFVLWIVGDTIFNGFLGIKNEPNLFFQYSKNSTAQSLVNTFLVIFVCLLIGFPFSLIVAIYLNEYSKSKTFKKIVVFFLDSLGMTPSILFGMFGLLLFIQVLGLTSSGSLGNSLIAGSLTLIIVILPSFIRLLENALKTVPNEIRSNSFALGNSKLQTIFKLVLPMALVPIITSIVSIIGRILSETAPLYLTAGLSSSVITSLDRPGTTLTTQIYAQLFSSTSNSKDIQYQAALMTITFVLILIVIGYFIIPKWQDIKLRIKHIFKRIITS